MKAEYQNYLGRELTRFSKPPLELDYPLLIGASYTFVPTTLSILLAGRYKHIVNPHEVGLSQALVD